MDNCPHCAAGNAPVWQGFSGEWVHRFRGGPDAGGGRTFSTTICRAPPRPPAEPQQARKAA